MLQKDAVTGQTNSQQGVYCECELPTLLLLLLGLTKACAEQLTGEMVMYQLLCYSKLTSMTTHQLRIPL